MQNVENPGKKEFYWNHWSATAAKVWCSKAACTARMYAQRQVRSDIRKIEAALPAMPSRARTSFTKWKTRERLIRCDCRRYNRKQAGSSRLAKQTVFPKVDANCIHHLMSFVHHLVTCLPPLNLEPSVFGLDWTGGRMNLRDWTGVRIIFKNWRNRVWSGLDSELSSRNREGRKVGGCGAVRSPNYLQKLKVSEVCGWWWWCIRCLFAGEKRKWKRKN